MQNDRGTYIADDVHASSANYLTTGTEETGMGDGIYRGATRQDSPHPKMVVPYTMAELNAVCLPARQDRKLYNRLQRRVRVVVEQTFGIIKAWGLCGNTIYRGDLDHQGRNFVLCTYLTSRPMRVRNAYPRSPQWLETRQDSFSHVKDRYLEIDPLHPELY